MDLFLKISVLKAKFCWLGDLDKIICPWKLENCPTSDGKLPSKSGCRCPLLAGNLFISLAGSEKQMNFYQQSPKMFKIASEIFIRAFLLFLGLFLKNFPSFAYILSM